MSATADTPFRLPLEQWLAARLGLPPGRALTRGDVERHQRAQLGETIDRCRRKSPFYRERLAGLALPGRPAAADLAALPFTLPEDLRQTPLGFLCVSQSDVSRVVTLQTSGTTGPGKRIFFTDEDLEQTVDFFHHGMTGLAAPGDRVLILLPGPTPDSVGDLLCRALARMDAQGRLADPFAAPGEILETMNEDPVDCLVGTPMQLLALVRHPESGRILKGSIKSVLLSTDYVPQPVSQALERQWGCRVFEHYGMTEMGYGGAVDCAALDGYHLREADLLFEIVDPATGAPLPDGRTGEVVFTTLTRRGMPLLRYRTGDLAAVLPEPCACGSVLRRLSHVRGRLDNQLRLGSGACLSLAELDAVLFDLPDVVYFQAAIANDPCRDLLQLTVYAHSRNDRDLRSALERVPCLQKAVASDILRLAPVDWRPAEAAPPGPAKRCLGDLRKTKKNACPEDAR